MYISNNINHRTNVKIKWYCGKFTFEYFSLLDHLIYPIVFNTLSHTQTHKILDFAQICSAKCCIYVYVNNNSMDYKCNNLLLEHWNDAVKYLCWLTKTKKRQKLNCHCLKMPLWQCKGSPGEVAEVQKKRKSRSSWESWLTTDWTDVLTN